MTTNPYERAVIEAARLLTARVLHDVSTDLLPLVNALDALDAHEASLAPGIRERDWHEVTEGDELLGNNGKFYPVTRTLKVQRGKYEIVVKLPSGEKVLTRPTPEAPSATVRRGAAGQAVDLFVNVFSSGGR